jgi:hypothetical protein
MFIFVVRKSGYYGYRLYLMYFFLQNHEKFHVLIFIFVILPTNVIPQKMEIAIIRACIVTTYNINGDTINIVLFTVLQLILYT